MNCPSCQAECPDQAEACFTCGKALFAVVQGTVLGGGRYDGLMESLGGPPTPAVGWAAGIERLAMLVGEVDAAPLQVAVVAEHPNVENDAIRLVAMFRRAGIRTELFATGNLKKRFDRAKKASPLAIASLDFREGEYHQSMKFDHGDTGDAMEIFGDFYMRGA